MQTRALIALLLALLVGCQGRSPEREGMASHVSMSQASACRIGLQSLEQSRVFRIDAEKCAFRKGEFHEALGSALNRASLRQAIKDAPTILLLGSAEGSNQIDLQEAWSVACREVSAASKKFAIVYANSEFVQDISEVTGKSYEVSVDNFYPIKPSADRSSGTVEAAGCADDLLVPAIYLTTRNPDIDSRP